MSSAFAKVLYTKDITYQLLFLLLGENFQVQHNNQLSKTENKWSKNNKAKSKVLVWLLAQFKIDQIINISSSICSVRQYIAVMSENLNY